MNQLRHIFAVSANISNRASLRSSSITRSAGTNGSNSKRTRNLGSDDDHSSDVKLSGRSYAKLIADYGKEIEARNAATKFNGDSKVGGGKVGFFSKTPFQRLARVSSLVKITNGRNNSGPSLSTKSSSRPPVTPTSTNDKSTKTKDRHGETDVADRAIERAERPDNVAKAHGAKETTKNEIFTNNYGDEKYMAHPLVQRIAKSNSLENTSSNEFINSTNRRISSVKKIPDAPKSDTKNVSVVVKSHRKNDKDKNDLSTVDSGDNDAMLVTLTEESKSSSTSNASPLRHIDLRINGKPATGANTLFSKVEKLDVVSSAEKIEIRIPVLSGATAADKLRAPNSTINVFISNQGKDASTSRESIGKVSQSGDSRSGDSKSGLAHPSTFFISKIQNVKKNDRSADRSKVVPWWTTIESFRRSETIPAKSTKRATTLKILEMKTTGVDETVASSNEEANAAEVKNVAINDAEMMRVKPVVTKLSSPRQRTNSRRKGTSAISKIIGKELQKKSEQRQEEQNTRHRLPRERSNSDVKPEAKPDTKVKSTASNEPKKEASSSVAIGSTMPGKSIQAETPTPDRFAKKISASLGSTVAASGRVSKTESKSSKGQDTRGNNNLSNANDFNGRIHAKPISLIGKGSTNAVKRGRSRSTGQVSKDLGSDSVGSKIGTKPIHEVSTKLETNEPARLSRNYGKIKLLPSTQSSAKPVNSSTNKRCASIKRNGVNANTGEKLSKVKNSTIIMRPIEKKKDGTLIDYGVTVATRKKLERKLSRSRSTDGVQRKRIMKQEEPVVIATIKEVIPKSNRDVRGNTINRNIEDPSFQRNVPDKNRRQTSETRDHCRDVQKKWNKVPSKGTTNELNESRTPRTPMNEEKRNSKASTDSQVVETVTPDKKLLYSVWLRRFKERTGQDPDPTKDPTSRDS